MILTKELFEAGRSDAGGHNLKQLSALGLELPEKGWPKTGWPSKLIGKDVTDEQYARFMDLRKKNPENVPQKDLFSVPLMVATCTSEQLDQLESMILERRKLLAIDHPYDEDELNEFIRKGTEAWKDVPDASKWVRELRGSPEDFANELYEKNGRDLA